MQEEGADVSVYIHNGTYRENYKGLLKNVLSFEDLKSFPLGKGTLAIFDMVRPYEHEMQKADGAVLRLCHGEDYKPTPGEGVFGPLATKLAAVGTRVIGMSEETELLELNRAAGKQLAEEIGLPVAPHVVCDSIGAALEFLQERPNERFVLKPHGNDDLDLTYLEHFPGELIEKLHSKGFASRLTDKRFLIEKYIEGITFDEEVWWNGDRFRALNSTIEHKRFGTGDTGPNVGSSLNVVWAKGQSLVNWAALVPFLQRTGYIGPIDATFQVDSSGAAWFLEWGGFRLGYDAVFCLFELLRGNITHFFDNDFGVGLNDDQVAASIRFSLQPYPYEVRPLCEKYAAGSPILSGIEDAWWFDVKLGKRGMECAGADGILGAMASKHDEPKAAMELSLKKIRKLKVCGDLQYRTDGAELQLEWDTLTRMGWAAMC
jgi:hypothetical protein